MGHQELVVLRLRHVASVLLRRGRVKVTSYRSAPACSASPCPSKDRALLRDDVAASSSELDRAATQRVVGLDVPDTRGAARYAWPELHRDITMSAGGDRLVRESSPGEDAVSGR